MNRNRRPGKTEPNNPAIEPMKNAAKVSANGRARLERSAVVTRLSGRRAIQALEVRAFTLIEVISILAVIAVLVAVLLPAFIKQLDRLAAEKETAILKKFAQALEQSVKTNKRIPATVGNDWAQVLAASAGFQVSD